jgi:hypothetical protein
LIRGESLQVLQIMSNFSNVLNLSRVLLVRDGQDVTKNDVFNAISEYNWIGVPFDPDRSFYDTSVHDWAFQV